MLRDVAGQAVWVVERGQGTPARLFIHCSLARHEALFPLAGALSPARNMFFDLPGHGRSAAWDGSDYQTDTANIAAALLDGPTHIVGHSFGATVALRLAVERPDLVSRLTLIEPVMFAAVRDTTARDNHADLMRPFVTAWTAGNRNAATQAFVEMWGVGAAWDDIPAAKRAALAAQIHLIPAAAPAIEDDIHNIVPRLRAVSCPVDLIEGAASQPIMPAILNGLAAGMPHANRHVIDGAGHMVALTHAGVIASALEGR